MLVAIQLRVNVHGAGSFAESSPMQRFWRDANSAARHTALDSIIGYKVYGKALLGIDEVVTRMVRPRRRAVRFTAPAPHSRRAPRRSH
ncbi:MAG: hypothetical protein QOD88_559 [Mycobacterium sp.]|nr:hypothetical protein [Mycobacterium sp.]